MHYNIAIDGPSGAGKSSVARALAKRLGISYIDTGAMYRTIALSLKRHGIDLADEKALETALEAMDLSYVDGNVALDGRPVGNEIRTEEISRFASQVSQIPVVREALLGFQRELAKHQSVIMEGRDIATVVLPDAHPKFFLTASTEVRAKRRFDQLQEAGLPADFAAIEKDIRDRDERDAKRSVAPLKPAEDATIIDNSTMTFDETVDAMLEIIQERT